MLSARYGSACTIVILAARELKALTPNCIQRVTRLDPSRHHPAYSQRKSFASHASNSEVQIAIVGGGLGGLTAARVLQRHGYNPVVFERDLSQDSRGQGGVLDLHPGSGQWALEQAGLLGNFMAAARPEGQDMRILDKDGTVLHEEVGSTGTEAPEIDRPLLRGILLDSLQQGTVKWDHHMTSMKPISNGPGHMLHFSNGDSMTADLVIGADGARSRVRPAVTDATPSYQGISTVEVVVPNADTHHPRVAKTVGQGSLFAMANNKGFWSQRTGDGSIRSYITFRMEQDTFGQLGIVFNPASEMRQTLVANFVNWAPELTELISACDGSFCTWPCYALPIGLRWEHQKGITLVGDAAHLTSPFAGEGANVAMQDGAELALALVNHKEVAAAIAEFEPKMFKRAQKASQQSADNLELFVSEGGSKQALAAWQQGYA